MLCPTDFGPEWQSRSLYYRGGAVITALLAAILHMTLEDSTGFYIFLVSMADANSFPFLTQPSNKMSRINVTHLRSCTSSYYPQSGP